MTTPIDSPSEVASVGGGTIGDADYRRRERAELLRFAAASVREDGFGNLDAKGVLEDTPTELYVTCRMTHVFALASVMDEPPAEGGPDRARLVELATHGIAALRGGALHDGVNGGWHSAASGPRAKNAYGHAFVMLAASSGVVAGIEGAADLLAEAIEVQTARFLQPDTGLVVDDWNTDWSELDPYRGVNANMHTVEAYLAVGDATGDPVWHERAARIAERVRGWAAENQWRIPEHFDNDWNPDFEYNRDEPAHPFRPYGATVGHGLEWSRLFVSVDLGQPTPGLVDAAVALADRAVEDGWARDGADGFVYTTDWNGEPVTHARMHWVLAEAIATGAVLRQVTGEPRFSELVQRSWDYADRYLIDRVNGSWHHELDRENRPSGGTWSGKLDAYHAYQAALIQDVPLATSFAAAVRLARDPEATA